MASHVDRKGESQYSPLQLCSIAMRSNVDHFSFEEKALTVPVAPRIGPEA